MNLRLFGCLRFMKKGGYWGGEGRGGGRILSLSVGRGESLFHLEGNT